jgi:hypothetical protein
MQMCKAEHRAGIAHLWLAAARGQALRRCHCVGLIVQQGTKDTQTLDRRLSKFGRAGHAADVNVIRLMRIACWIPKATDTRPEYVIMYCFPTATVVIWTRPSLYYFACFISSFFLSSTLSTASSFFPVFFCLYLLCDIFIVSTLHSPLHIVFIYVHLFLATFATCPHPLYSHSLIYPARYCTCYTYTYKIKPETGLRGLEGSGRLRW